MHPAEYANRFPQTAAAFDIIRNNRAFETFNSLIETALLLADTDTALEALDTRPGELARRLDHLARITRDATAVVSHFRTRADKVSTPVLLQVMTHFRHRNESSELRVFFPKGRVAKPT